MRSGKYFFIIVKICEGQLQDRYTAHYSQVKKVKKEGDQKKREGVKGVGRKVGGGRERGKVQSIISTFYRRGNSGRKR